MEVHQIDTDDGRYDRIDPDAHQADTHDRIGNRMDPQVLQVDTGDRTGDGIDPGVHQVDRQRMNLPSMVGEGMGHPISVLWQWNKIDSG